MIEKEALSYLFAGYLENGGTGVYSLDEISQKYSLDAHQLGSHLNKNGWIKNPNFGPFGFSCQISHNGIQKIRPDYFSGLIST
ncbi:MAG: hypothetical protein EOO01_11915, partial [Chitinophagaceae bacterium]